MSSLKIKRKKHLKLKISYIIKNRIIEKQIKRIICKLTACSDTIYFDFQQFRLVGDSHWREEGTDGDERQWQRQRRRRGLRDGGGGCCSGPDFTQEQGEVPLQSRREDPPQARRRPPQLRRWRDPRHLRPPRHLLLRCVRFSLALAALLIFFLNSLSGFCTQLRILMIQGVTFVKLLVMYITPQ